MELVGAFEPTASHLQEIHGIGVSEYERLVVHHLLDSLFIDEKMDIITSLYGSHKNLLNDILTNVRRDFGRLFEVVERTMVRYFDEIVMVIGDESSFRRGVLLATNENDVLLYVQTATDIDSWEPGLPSDYERNSAGSSAKNFGDAINRFVINPNRIFRVMGFFSVFKEREVILK
jgi:hypothetical protein